MGHLRRQKQGARSTKKSQQTSAEELMNFEEIKTSQATINLKREQKLGIIGTIKFGDLKGMIS